MLASGKPNFTSPLRKTVVWSGAMKRDASTNWPTPAVQRLNTLNWNAIAGNFGTRI
jgi:hypothetical protein